MSSTEGGDQSNRAALAVRNQGDHSVRITSLETDCSCTSAEIRPNALSPGEVAQVFLGIKPFRRGSRVVSIRLKTDSLVQPIMELHLRFHGSDAPPYMLAADGSLDFSIGETQQTSGLLTVKTLVPHGEEAREPQIEYDIPQLKVSPNGVEERTATDLNAKIFMYKYLAKLQDPSLARTVRGYIHVRDPWHREHVEGLLCVIDVPPSIRVAPTHLLFKVSESAPSAVKNSLMVVTKGNASQVTVDCEHPEDCPLRVHRSAQSEGSSSTAIFEITVANDAALHEGTWRLLVKDATLDQAIATVPVRLLIGK